MSEIVRWSNPVRSRLESGDFVIGMTVTGTSLDSAAHAAKLGFHFLWVEMEHSPLTLETLRAIVLTTRGLPASVFARVPVVELWTAKRVLDQGVQGVIFPFTSTPELAARAVAGCRYPPVGRRGSGAGLAVGCWPEAGSYYDSADKHVMVVTVVEEASALDHIEEIAATPGLDVIFIGVSDLSFSLGLRGRQNEPLLEEAIAKIVDAAKRNNKFLGRPVKRPSDVQRFREQGFQFFQSVTELGLMTMGAAQLLEPLGITGVPASERALY